MLKPFWHSDYWFRETDGFWLRSKTASGPSRKPDIVVEYGEPMPACTIPTDILSADK